MITAALLWSLGLADSPSLELTAYVQAADPSFQWSSKTVLGHEALGLVSQSWKGAIWRHDVVIVRPKGELAPSDAMIIEVTGWTPNSRDIEYAQSLADGSGLPVALLFHIPNQPLWGHEEDDLIAYTFERFFETGDATWPLLFPMVKSVKATMDAVGEASKSWGKRVDKFVITGASKRGWTSWLVGAIGDKRVVGIAPAVFDNLDFVAQLKQQKAYWSAYSPMIADYTDRGLQDLLDSEPGKKLVQLVDPANYLSKINVPVLVLTGTNDPYWTVDSTQVYWDKMAMPKWSLAVPNAGHVMGDKDWWVPSVAEFAGRCASGRSLPHVASKFSTTSDAWELRVDVTPGPISYRVWKATSTDLHFDKAEWAVAESVDVPSTEGRRGIVATGERAKSFNIALLMELEFEKDGRRFRVTTPVHLARKR